MPDNEFEFVIVGLKKPFDEAFNSGFITAAQQWLEPYLMALIRTSSHPGAMLQRGVTPDVGGRGWIPHSGRRQRSQYWQMGWPTYTGESLAGMRTRLEPFGQFKLPSVGYTSSFSARAQAFQRPESRGKGSGLSVLVLSDTDYANPVEMELKHLEPMLNNFRPFIENTMRDQMEKHIVRELGGR